jgi:hypothetical protein
MPCDSLNLGPDYMPGEWDKDGADCGGEQDGEKDLVRVMAILTVRSPAAVEMTTPSMSKITASYAVRAE